MKLKKVWMLSVFVFLFHMKNSMINIFFFLTQKVTIVPCYHVKFLSVGFRVFHDLCGVCRNAIARSFF